MLHWQSGTLFLTKSGHPTPSHSSDHHLKVIFFSSPTDCVCVCGGGERGKESEGERRRERERTSGLLQKCERFCFVFHLFCFMQWALCSEGEMAQKRTHFYH